MMVIYWAHKIFENLMRYVGHYVGNPVSHFFFILPAIKLHKFMHSELEGKRNVFQVMWAI